MKKLLCMMLSLLLLLSVVCLPRASAAENYSVLFGEAINALRWNAPFVDVPVGASFPVTSMINYVRRQLSIEEYGREPITSGELTYFAYYAIPADVFEAAVAAAFATVDVEALRSYTSFFWDHLNFTGIDDFQNYQPEEQVYLFSSTSVPSEASYYEVLGYTEADGLYTVYSRFLLPLPDAPQGAEGVDYLRLGDHYFDVSHYLRTVIAIVDEQVQFHSWEEVQELPDAPMTVPVTVLSPEGNVTVQSAPGVFPADTVIEIRQPLPEALDMMADALLELAEGFVAYDITATAQPNGQALVTFPIPEGFDPAALALFHICEAGVAQQLEITVDAEAGTVTAALTHFSLYALAQLTLEGPLPGDVNGDGRVNARDARLLLQYVAGLVETDALAIDAADLNGDGRINARDARALLQLVAGLDDGADVTE